LLFCKAAVGGYVEARWLECFDPNRKVRKEISEVQGESLKPEA